MSLISLIITALNGGATGTTGGGGGSTVPLLIVFAGESNSGGQAANSYATSGELAPRNLKILNNTTLASFDALDIGTNNLVGHVGLGYASASAHAWELELANQYDAGVFGSRPVYLVKAGQGGSIVNQWLVGGSYTAESTTIGPYSTFISRVNAAIPLVETLTGQTPDVVLFWSQGINDRDFASGDITTWTSKTQTVFSNMRTDLGLTLPIFSTQFQGMTNLGPFNTAIAGMESSVTNFHAIDTTGAETAQVFDGAGYHWGYTGAKAVANSLITALLSLL
jgi:hypothetical protein